MWDAFRSTKLQVKYKILVHHSHSSHQESPLSHKVLMSTHHYFKWLRYQHYYLWQIKEGTMFSESQSLIRF